MRASGYDRAASDYYVEPAWVVDALLDVEALPCCSWDPACGAGNIPKRMNARGLSCLGSDIADRGFGHTKDFFTYSASVQRIGNIVSNPPYGVIEPFIRHALTLVNGKVVILARLALLEGQKRRQFFADTPLARVWVSSRRVSMPPGGTNVAAKGGAIAYAWFVWEHGYRGAPALGWLA